MNRKNSILFLNGRAGEVLGLLGVDLEIPEGLRKHRTDLIRQGRNLLVAIHADKRGNVRWLGVRLWQV